MTNDGGQDLENEGGQPANANATVLIVLCVVSVVVVVVVRRRHFVCDFFVR